MINCAILGLGRWGRSLVKAADGLERLIISRAVETDLDRARPFCAEHGIALTGDFDAILADPAIDAILLATPHSLHKPQPWRTFLTCDLIIRVRTGTSGIEFIILLSGVSCETIAGHSGS